MDVFNSENLTIVGGNNIISSLRNSNQYSGTGDFQASKQALFGSNNPNNYRLVAGAPAINAGSTNIPSYDRDIRGFLVDSTPDIGAYEFGDQFGPVDPNPDPSTTNVWLEAECASTIGSAWEVVSDGSASQSSYLKSIFGNSSGNAPPTDPDKLLTFDFSVSTAGQYKIFSRQRESGSASDDSFWIKVNNSAWTQFNMRGAANTFFWQAVGTLYSLQVGNNTITIGIREDNAQLDKLFVTLDGSLPNAEGGAADNCSVPPSPVTELWLEAECATVGANWQIQSDAQATSGQYAVYPSGLSLSSPPSSLADQLVYSFEVSQSGSYFLRARIKAPDLASNSLWVKIDNQPWIKWWEGIAISGQFAWNQAPGNPFTLSSGNHTLTVAYREAGTQLDKFQLSTSSNLPTGQGEAASNCTTTPPPQPVVTADAGSDKTVSLGSTVQLSGRGIGPNPFRGYFWEKMSGPSLTLNARGANATLTNLQVGTYVMRFTATDSEGNSGSDEMTLTVTSSNARTASTTKAHPAAEKISEFAQPALSAYPNPANGSITVKLPDGDQQPGVLTLTDVSGKVVHRQVVSDAENVSSLSIPTERIGEGMYLLRWQQENKQQTFKLFVNH